MKDDNHKLLTRVIYILLVLFVFADLGFSFMQHLNQPLDGDMAWNLVPSDDVQPILNNPLGIKAIAENTTYVNPNRFFCHWSFRAYLLNAPILLQKLTDPINSVYLACGIAKILIQALLIFMLAVAITRSTKIWTLDFMMTAALVTPFFQTNGYRGYMGIIDPSTTYTFFYALPCLVLMLYLMPFVYQFFHQNKSKHHKLLLFLNIPLAFVVCLSGPLNPGIVLVFSVIVFIQPLIRNFIENNQHNLGKRFLLAIKSIPKNYWYFLLPVCILSLYSLFLGKYNSITIETQIPLAEMYMKLPQGVYNQFTQKLGFPILFAILTLNTVILLKFIKNERSRKLIKLFKGIGLFALLYILLLPLGGHRDYRPNIMRYDTIMPITLALIFFFGLSTKFILYHLTKKQNRWYIPLIVLVALIFTNSDKLERNKNDLEVKAIEGIASKGDRTIPLSYDSTVLSWRKTITAEESKLNAKLLEQWHILSPIDTKE